MRAAALRYALAPACVLLAVLLHLSPAGATLHPTGLFAIAVLAAAWFGGAGPGFLAAVLATFTLPQLIAMSYPLLGGFLDLPRFVTFSVVGLAVGWGSSRRAGKLREQERYARAMEASDDGFWDWIPATDTVYASPRLLEIYGFAPGTTFNGRDDLVRSIPFHPEDRLQMARAIAEHFAGKRTRLDIQMRFTRDGETRWVHLAAVAVRDSSGAVVRWTGTVRDITEQKRVEEALRASEERYSLAMEASEEGYVDSDIDTDQFVTSERLNEILGLPHGTRFADRSDYLSHFRFYEDDGKTYEDMIRAVGTPGGPDRYEIEVRVVLRSGEMRWLWTRGKVTRDAAGRARRRIGVVADITARKLAEQALRESEDRFARAVAGSYDGVWDIDFVARSVYFSARTRELCGLPPGPEVVPLDGWFEALPLHPEDRPRRTAAVQAHLSGKAPVYEGEFRILQPDGVYRWRHLHGVCVRDADGKPLRMAGSISDVDARRRAEDALRESEERYERAMDSSEVGYWDWIPAVDKIYASPRLAGNLRLCAGHDVRRTQRPSGADSVARRRSPDGYAGICRPHCRQDGTLQGRDAFFPGRRNAMGVPDRHGEARPFGRIGALGGHGARRNRAQAFGACATAVRRALRARHGRERVGILGLGHPHRPVLCLAESVRTGRLSARNHVGHRDEYTSEHQYAPGGFREMGGCAGGVVRRNGRATFHGSALHRPRGDPLAHASRPSAGATTRARSYGGPARQPTSRSASGRRKGWRRWSASCARRNASRRWARLPAESRTTSTTSSARSSAMARWRCAARRRAAASRATSTAS